MKNIRRYQHTAKKSFVSQHRILESMPLHTALLSTRVVNLTRVRMRQQQAFGRRDLQDRHFAVVPMRGAIPQSLIPFLKFRLQELGWVHTVVNKELKSMHLFEETLLLSTTGAWLAGGLQARERRTHAYPSAEHLVELIKIAGNIRLGVLDREASNKQQRRHTNQRKYASYY